MPTISTVTVVGANGNLGKPMLEALLNARPSFQVSALKRAASKSVIPGTGPGSDGKVAVIEVAQWTLQDLTAALKGQDAVVVCFPLARVQDHLTLAQAAAAAGVRRYFPADFGSTDARFEHARKLVPLYAHKENVRKTAAALAADHPGFTWTCIVGGHFLDWGLDGGFLHVDLDTRTAELLDDGSATSSLSTLPRLAEATVAVLQGINAGTTGDSTANQVLYVQSFCVSQQALLASVQRAVAALDVEKGAQGKEWTTSTIPMDEFVAQHQPKADAGDKKAIDELVFALGVMDGDWTWRSEYAQKKLGLEDQDLDEVVTQVVRAHFKAT